MKAYIFIFIEIPKLRDFYGALYTANEYSRQLSRTLSVYESINLICITLERCRGACKPLLVVHVTV